MVYVYIFTRTFLFFFGMMVESIPSLSYGHGRMDEHISAVRARNDMNSFSKPRLASPSMRLSPSLIAVTVHVWFQELRRVTIIFS